MPDSIRRACVRAASSFLPLIVLSCTAAGPSGGGGSGVSTAAIDSIAADALKGGNIAGLSIGVMHGSDTVALKVLSAASYRDLIAPGSLNDGTAPRYGLGLALRTVGGHRLIEHWGRHPRLPLGVALLSRRFTHRGRADQHGRTGGPGRHRGLDCEAHSWRRKR